MARMHSGARGKSGSKKPINKTRPSWMTHNAKEIELLIAKLAKEGKTASVIGLHLRDVYGIPSVRSALNKKLTKVLQEKHLASELPEDLLALVKRSVNVQKHFETNMHDMTAKRGVQLIESKIKRLVKYYKKTKRLPSNWKYDAKNIRLYAE